MHSRGCGTSDDRSCIALGRDPRATASPSQATRACGSASRVTTPPARLSVGSHWPPAPRSGDGRTGTCRPSHGHGADDRDRLLRRRAQAGLTLSICRPRDPQVEPTRENKADLLARLRDQGVFLIDLKQDPVHGGSLAEEVPGLVRRVHALAPMKIIVIKTSVFDLVRDALLDDGLPLVDERVPFPGSGRQRRFEASFARALRHRPRAHHQ